MKRAIGWLLSWLLYYLGDIVSRTITNRQAWLYPLYNWLMWKSTRSQDWGGGAGAWLPAKQKDEMQ